MWRTEINSLVIYHLQIVQINETASNLILDHEKASSVSLPKGKRSSQDQRSNRLYTKRMATAVHCFHRVKYESQVSGNVV